MNRRLVYIGSVFLLVGLVVFLASGLQAKSTLQETFTLPPSETQLLSGADCEPGDLETQDCMWSRCIGLTRGECSGSCLRCTADDTDVTCESDCESENSCETIPPVLGGCGFWINPGECKWIGGACICDGPESSTPCRRYRANSC